MTPDGLLVADSDMHVLEPADLWERWIAPEWRHVAPGGPTEYMRRSCFLSVEADEETVVQDVQRFGDDNLIFSTDYPGADSRFPKAVGAFRTLPLPASAQRKILWDDWSRLYHIPAPAPAGR